MWYVQNNRSKIANEMYTNIIKKLHSKNQEFILGTHS